MTKYLAIAFLITGFLVGDAYGDEEVYYCAETMTNGFAYNKKIKKYQPARIVTSKFKIKLDKAANRLELAKENNKKDIFNCTTPANPKVVQCHHFFDSFNFNINTGRFVSAYTFGYVYGDHDQNSVSYGTCDKF